MLLNGTTARSRMQARWACGPRPTALHCSTISATDRSHASASRRAAVSDRMKLACYLLFALFSPLWAQTAELRGVITDQTGAVVPGAIINLRGQGGAAPNA